jgi:DNA (cytosine-5)-methyltransferase 1
LTSSPPPLAGFPSPGAAAKPRAYYNENDPFAAAWLRELIRHGHIAPGDVDERDIREVQPDDVNGYTQAHFFAGIGGWSLALRLADWSDERPVWTGSCPCQPFSAAGKQKGHADERHLWPDFFRLIRQCRPVVVFGEQVASSAVVGSSRRDIAGDHGSPARSLERLVGANRATTEGASLGTWLDGVFADLEGEGYAVGAAVLPASAANAPHRRDRLWFVADAEWDQQPRQESRCGTTGRVGRERQPLPWDGAWPAALARFRALGDGFPRCVEGTDAARNAIVPQAAAEFITAFALSRKAGAA